MIPVGNGSSTTIAAPNISAENLYVSGPVCPAKICNPKGCFLSANATALDPDNWEPTCNAVVAAFPRELSPSNRPSSPLSLLISNVFPPKLILDFIWSINDVPGSRPV